LSKKVVRRGDRLKKEMGRQKHENKNTEDASKRLAKLHHRYGKQPFRKHPLSEDRHSVKPEYGVKNRKQSKSGKNGNLENREVAWGQTSLSL